MAFPHSSTRSCTAHTPPHLPTGSQPLQRSCPKAAKLPTPPPKPPAPKLATRKLVSVPCGCWLCQLSVAGCQLSVAGSAEPWQRTPLRGAKHPPAKCGRAFSETGLAEPWQRTPSANIPLNADEHLAGPIAPPLPRTKQARKPHKRHRQNTRDDQIQSRPFDELGDVQHFGLFADARHQHQRQGDAAASAEGID